MKNSKKILMAASILGILSGCAAQDPYAHYYTSSPEFKEFKENLDSEERSESASYHVIGGTTVLRVGNRYYVR